MLLYDNPFSPFARKVRLALSLKSLAHDVVDGLERSNRERLAALNGRVEVPALVDDEIVVVGSADIVAYLDHRYPAHPMLPSDPALRVRARAWERCSDTLVDAIFTNVSYWVWAERDDTMPAGLLGRAQKEMTEVYDAMERALSGHDYLCEELSIADVALFVHVAAGRMLQLPFSLDRHPNVAAWLKRVRQRPAFSADLQRARAYVATAVSDGVDIERRKIFWRGDRIEWMLSRGFSDWFHQEIREDRVLWPGLALPHQPFKRS